MHDFIFVKTGNSYTRIFFSDIQYIEARGKHTLLITSKGRLRVLLTINAIQRCLPAWAFCRIHRSFMVSLSHVESFDSGWVDVGVMKLPIGKGYGRALASSVGILGEEEMKYIPLSEYDWMVLANINRMN